PQLPARRSSRHGSSWRCRNAAIASPARSCPRRHCLPPTRSQATPTSTLRCPETSAAAGPIRAYVTGSSTRRELRRLTRKGPEMILGRISDVLERDSDMNLSRRQFLSASAALGGGLLIGFTAGR